ncbi:hypothetical protein [Micromonospora sp. DT227]
MDRAGGCAAVATGRLPDCADAGFHGDTRLAWSGRSDTMDLGYRAAG